ncbi:DUF362 domain-containing protein [Candidatus Sumerlaeota bacterium]|nr:DUF362 domain-containing protein [Candidatus Sumerlaeota bacterium]
MNPSRRQFLRQSLTAVAAGAAVSCGAEPQPARQKTSGGGSKRSLVVRAHRPNVRAAPDRYDLAVLDEMLGACMARLTNTADAASAWKSLFSPKDHVALKINTLGGKLSTSPAVVDAIVRGLVSAGVAENHILVWDRFNRELISAGFTIKTSGKGHLCAGTEEEYDNRLTVHGQIGGSLSRLLTEFATAMINVPILKDHNVAGLAVSMKNLYGIIDNPNRYHGNNCDPYIADIADLPIVREKMRLIVCDAIYAQYEAGPTYYPKYYYAADTIMAATDPVALDTVGWQMIEAKRREAGLKSLEDSGRPPRWLATAAARGIGQNDLGKIDVADV